MRHQLRQLLVGIVVFHHHRRREVAQQGRRGVCGNAVKDESLFCLGQLQHAGGGGRFCRGRAIKSQRHVAALVIEQANRNGDMERQRLLLPGGGLAALAERQLIGLFGGVVVALHFELRRAGLAIPALELGEVAPAAVCHRRAEIVAANRLPVMPCKVQVHALAEAVTPQQGLDHAHHLGTFFINRDRVEIADLHKTVRPHRMRHGPRVFGKLHLAQHAHIFDATHRATAVRADHVGGKFLIAEHREAFLQRQLKPVAAGDAVTGPIMKVFMADHRLDIGVIGIGGDAGVGQHILGVEDIQALVFHRAHVEVAHRNDHEAIQIQLQPVTLLIPADAVLERFHRMLRLVQIARLHPHLQQHFSSTI